MSQFDRYRFLKVETESTSHLRSGCKKRMSEQLDTQRHNKVCQIIRYICKNLNIPVPESPRKHELNAIIENKDVMLMYESMIPSSVNMENRAMYPDI